MVMAGLVPAIHAAAFNGAFETTWPAKRPRFAEAFGRLGVTWMAGTSPAMTRSPGRGERRPLRELDRSELDL